MTKNELTITIAGTAEGVDADSVVKILRDALLILDGIDKGVSYGSKPTNKWRIANATMHSPLSITIVGEPAIADVPATPVTGRFVTAIRVIERRARRPRYFDDGMLTRMKSMVSHLNNGVASIQFEEPKKKALATLKIASHVDAVRAKTTPEFYDSPVELEGRLEKINVHGRAEFFVYDRSTDNATRCLFNEDEAIRAGALLTRRIRVRGVARFDRENQPVSMRVEGFEAIPDSLPSLRDIHRKGVSITGDLDSVEYVRRLRDG